MYGLKSRYERKSLFLSKLLYYFTKSQYTVYTLFCQEGRKMLRGSNAWDLKSVVIVAINMQNQYHRAFTAQMLYATHDYIDSSGRIFEDTCQIFENRDNYTIREKTSGIFWLYQYKQSFSFSRRKIYEFMGWHWNRLPGQVCIRTSFLVDMEQTSKQKMVREMITVFKDDALYIELQEKCRVNALLSKRVEDVRKLMTDLSYAKKENRESL